MKSLGLLAALTAACLFSVGAASAAPPAPVQTLPVPASPAPNLTTILDGPTPISPAAVPGGGVGTLPTKRTGPVVGPPGATTLDCGACILTCWSAQTRSGSDDWSGHAYIYQHLYWCGNGAQVTYANVGQSYDQAGWYTIGQTFGPWFSGGCTGCSSLRASGYMFWNWSSPLVTVHHSGTSHLDTTMYAWGSIST